ncbi:hypothetical protein [Mycobacterium sp.]|uniref:hypothetical protein n=1 Tax=Mycobacterium sp. TaxID=1785 RepID=UPI002BC1FD9E|nr:hypothetical protein [Mycobacterium sp.]HTY32092.1 hypothetical protein [Mycobacterium sp.]
MSIRHGFLFGDDRAPQGNAPSSSDVAASPAAVWPATGERNKAYEQPPVAQRLSTTGGLGDETAHGDVESYRRTQQRYGGIPSDMDGGITSAGYAVPTHGDEFSTTGHFPDPTGTGVGIAGEDHLVTRKGTLPPGTNEQSAGKAI